MFSENLRIRRKEMGLSQQALALRLHVVRQTVSKWEQGLSVPDSEMLLAVSAELDVPVNTLLGESIKEKTDVCSTLLRRIEILTSELREKKAAAIRRLSGLFIAAGAVTAAVFFLLAAAQSPYLEWNYSDPETAAAAAALHAFEWLFVRTAPVILAVCAAGIFLMRRKKREILQENLSADVSPSGSAAEICIHDDRGAM